MLLKRSLLVLGLVLAAVALGQQGAVAQGKQDRADGDFLQTVAQEQKVPVERLQLHERFTQDFPYSGLRLDVAAIWDKATGKSYEVSVDASGRRISLAEAEKAESDARTAALGKIDPALAAKLNGAGEKDQIAVTIWLNIPDMPQSRPVISGEGAQAAQAADAALRRQLTTLEQYMDARRGSVLVTLQSMGVQPRVPRFAPVLFANLTPRQIGALEKDPGVATMYAQSDYTLFQDDAGTTERVYPVWNAGNLGQLGSVKPVVHEPDGIADFNPYLNNATHPVIFFNSVSKMNTGPFPNNHSTNVAGVIASTHPLMRGIAPNVQVLLSANSQTFNDPDLVDAFEWARYNGGDPTNMSWGTKCGGDQTFWSRYADWVTRYLWATLVVSSGNTGYASLCGSTTEDEKVSAPGLAWNVITVGAFDDGDGGFWSGDAMSTFSRWRNPDFATAMEKPEVVAVGEDVITTENAGGTHLTAAPGVDGTSFSAPQVAGQVALMLSRQPGQKNWPETNKAAVLVSAYHDLLGGSADKSKDGVGGVVMTNSDDTYRLGRFVDYTWPSTYTAVLFSDRIPLTAGQVARVAIAWDSISTGGAGTDQLGANLDMCVRKPDNTNLTCSASAQNAWEMVEFTAPTTGAYDVVVTRTSAIAGWPGTFLGLAWSIRSLPDFCTGLVGIPSTGISGLSVSTVNGPTFFDSYAGWAPLQSGRERPFLFVLPATKDVTVTDNNNSMDLHVVQIASCQANPIVPISKGHGNNSVFLNNLPAGTYYIIVDGYSGYVGTTSLSVAVTGP